MNLHLPDHLTFVKGIHQKPAAERFRLEDLLDRIRRRGLTVFGWSVLLGILLGGLVVGVLVKLPPIYTLLGLGGLFFIALLFFKIEVAIILALFVHNLLGEFNYIGDGTPFHPNGLMGIAIICGTIFYFLFNKVNYSRLRAFGIALSFFLVCCVSLFFTKDRLMDGVNITLRLATSLSVFAILVYKLDSIKKVKWVIAAVVASQVFPTLNGLLEITGKTGLSFSKGETARLGNSGVGVYLAMILTICLVLLLNSKTKSGRLLWGGLTALFALGLFFSYGRAGWIGFLIAVLIVGLIRHKKLLLILPLLLIFMILLVPGISQRFSDIQINELGNRSSSTLAVRIEIWRAALRVYEDHPLLGVGYGVGRYLVGDYLSHYGWMIHNDYLSVLLETGILGLILFMLWHGQWLMSILKVYQGTKYEYDKALALGVFALFAASLVMRLTDNFLQDSYKMYYLSALVAAVLALPRIRADEALILAPRQDDVQPAK